MQKPNNRDKLIREFLRDVRKRMREEAEAAQPLLRTNSIATEGSANAGDRKTVMVVYGRNTVARRAMFAFLRVVGLQPVEWSRAVAATGTGSPYIADVVGKAFDMARAVVVLLTGDDVARLGSRFLSDNDVQEERDLMPQARPNVLFEAGLAFGTHPQRTILVQVGRIRPFSDIAGRHVLHLSNEVKARQQLVSRLKSAGCDVAEHGTDWIDEGDFDGAIMPPDF